jgi:hypothetical protein
MDPVLAEPSLTHLISTFNPTCLASLLLVERIQALQITRISNPKREVRDAWRVSLAQNEAVMFAFFNPLK